MDPGPHRIPALRLRPGNPGVAGTDIGGTSSRVRDFYFDIAARGRHVYRRHDLVEVELDIRPLQPAWYWPVPGTT